MMTVLCTKGMISPIQSNWKSKNNLLIFACLVLHLEKWSVPSVPNFSKESLTEITTESIQGIRNWGSCWGQSQDGQVGRV